MPTQTEMVKAITDYHGITRGSKSPKELMKEMKQKTGKYDIKSMYDALPGKAKVVEEAKVEAKSGEVLPPAKSATGEVVTTHHHKTDVDVKAPSMVFNLTPPQVTVNANSATWAYTLQRAAMYAFVFVSGVSFGVLAVVLKTKGIG